MVCLHFWAQGEVINGSSLWPFTDKLSVSFFLVQIYFLKIQDKLVAVETSLKILLLYSYAMMCCVTDTVYYMDTMV